MMLYLVNSRGLFEDPGQTVNRGLPTPALVSEDPGRQAGVSLKTRADG